MMWQSLKYLFLFSTLAFSFDCFSQVIVVPILKDQESKTESSARTADVTPLTLPFWDDFSDAAKEYPDENRWLYAKSAWVNTGMGINPPSLKVATLDGLDSLGKPYNVNDILAKGFADKMISQPIRLDLVDPSLRSTVYLSFYYEFQGNGEPPDAGDFLSLSLKNQSGVWEKVWSVENDGTLNKNTFVQILIPINADRFFHNSFQFRFQNFSRLSGPYDTWNLDYIYLNKGRASFDNSYPDRSITTPLGNLFKQYRSVPIKHFFENPNSIISKPTFSVYNLRIGNNQPLNFFSSAELKTYKNLVESIASFPLDNAEDIGALLGLQSKTAALNTLPPLTSYDASADSIKIKLSLTLTTKDNILEGPPDNGDYNPSKYAPIDFRKNDVVSGNFLLINFYGYDDGSAEYGAGLNQPGAQFAYQFDMTTTQPDTIVAIDVYFPKFGDESSQSIQLHLWKDLQGATGTVLHQQSITITRSSQNRFTRIPLTNFIGVKGKFFIGWKQSSAAIIAVGLDKSSDSATKMFFNTNSAWEQNISVHGSLMLRPVFGKGKGVITSVEEAVSVLPYPNPSSGKFNLPQNATNIAVFDLRGSEMTIEVNQAPSSKLVDIQHPSRGMYLVKFRLDQKLYSAKIMVLEP